MIDYKNLTKDPEAFVRALMRRNAESPRDMVQLVQQFVLRRNVLTTELQNLQKARNDHAIEIGKRKNDITEKMLETGRDLKAKIDKYTDDLAAVDAELESTLAGYPNILDTTVPDGLDETHNVVIKSWGEAIPYGIPHFEYGAIAQTRVLAQKTANGRYVTMTGDLARLSRAVGQFLIDHNVDHGYTEVNPPEIVTADALYNTGQLPKFKNDLFPVQEEYLAPTAEVMLTNLVRDTIIPEQALPIRYTALTKCFRKEAGSAGRDTRGLIRLNEFEKVELVSIVEPDDANDELERMTQVAESCLEILGLPYRRVLLCAGDTGFSAAKTYDLEVWLPGMGEYREISSCSLCTDFQARRAQIRIKKPKTKVLAHTLNGSALAVGRTLAAIIENYRDTDGNISVPDALIPYMRGIKKISLV